MRRLAIPLVVLLSLTSVAFPLRAQLVRGQVVDSLTRQPLAGATITLLDEDDAAAMQTMADEAGLFQIRVAASGSYRFRVEYEGYRTSTFPPFDLDGVQSQAFMLLVRSREPLPEIHAGDVIDEMCGAGTLEPGRGVLTGFVYDGATQTPAANARVVATWPAVYGALAELVQGQGQDIGRASGEVTTDDHGVYAVCNVPAGAPVVFHAASDDRLSDFIEVQFESGAVLVGGTRRGIDQPLLRHDFQLMPPEARRAAVSGMVLDANTMQPMRDVTVALADAGVETSTDSRGAFHLEQLPAGPAHLVIRRPGFRPVTRAIELAHEETVAFPPGDLRLEVLPQELAPVVVTADQPTGRRPLGGFWERRERGGGDYVTREEFEAQGNPEVPTDVLRRMRGIRIITGVSGNVSAPGRRIVVTSRGQARAENPVDPSFPGCFPLYFLDGQYIGTSLYVDIDDILLLINVAAVEVYTSMATLPQQFNRTGSSCGVIVFWTR